VATPAGKRRPPPAKPGAKSRLPPGAFEEPTALPPSDDEETKDERVGIQSDGTMKTSSSLQRLPSATAALKKAIAPPLPEAAEAPGAAIVRPKHTPKAVPPRGPATQVAKKPEWRAGHAASNKAHVQSPKRAPSGTPKCKPEKTPLPAQQRQRKEPLQRQQATAKKAAPPKRSITAAPKRKNTAASHSVEATPDPAVPPEQKAQAKDSVFTNLIQTGELDKDVVDFIAFLDDGLVDAARSKGNEESNKKSESDIDDSNSDDDGSASSSDESETSSSSSSSDSLSSEEEEEEDEEDSGCGSDHEPASGVAAVGLSSGNFDSLLAAEASSSPPGSSGAAQSALKARHLKQQERNGSSEAQGHAHAEKVPGTTM
jgi:hypothetical protein